MPMFIEIERADNTPMNILHILRTPKAYIKFRREYYDRKIHAFFAQQSEQRFSTSNRKSTIEQFVSDLLPNRIDKTRIQ